MSTTPVEPQLAPAFTTSPAPHRRRPSAPPSPPGTPTDGCFPDSAGRTTPPPKHAQSVYPLTPPATPERATAGAAEEAKARLAALERDAAPPLCAAPPLDAHRRPPSKAYAHHRRTSTATILRMAMAGASRTQAPSGGMILTPSKLVTLFLIVLSATYLASFLPIPAALRIARPHPPHFQKPNSFVPPAMPAYARAAQKSRKVAPADSTQRVAFREALARRIPPPAAERLAAQAAPGRREYDRAVAVAAAAAHSTSQEGEFWRSHPEVLARGGHPVLRRGSSSSVRGQAPLAAPASSSSRSDADGDTFDRPAYRRPETPEAIAAAQRAAYHEREAQLARMKRVAVAHREARGSGYVPVDSSAQRAVALAEQERVYNRWGRGEPERT